MVWCIVLSCNTNNVDLDRCVRMKEKKKKEIAHKIVSSLGHLPHDLVLLIPFIALGNLALVFSLDLEKKTFLIPGLTKAAIVGIGGQMLLLRGTFLETSESKLLFICAIQFGTSIFGTLMGFAISNLVPVNQ